MSNGVSDAAMRKEGPANSGFARIDGLVHSLEPGTYVVAVSGGVDSMVLLDLLVQQAHNSQLTTHNSVSTVKPWKLIVAHFDHGIRDDSHIDRQLVQEIAAKHGLVFVYNEGNLGDVSEAVARTARYEFLERVRAASNAQAIITAHHQDDLLETAIINMLRGTGRKGLTSLKSTNAIKRPLLAIPKHDLLKHAKQNKLAWREDPTNQDVKYLRNYVRHKILPKFSPKQRQQLIHLLEKTNQTNREIDEQIANFLQFARKKETLDRQAFILLPHNIAREVLAGWLRNHEIRQFDQKLLERLVTAAKTLQPGKRVDVDKHHQLAIERTLLALMLRDR